MTVYVSRMYNSTTTTRSNTNQILILLQSFILLLLLFVIIIMIVMIMIGPLRLHHGAVTTNDIRIRRRTWTNLKLLSQLPTCIIGSNDII